MGEELDFLVFAVLHANSYQSELDLKKEENHSFPQTQDGSK